MASDPKESENRERLKNAVLAIKTLQAQLSSAERRQREPIAVIGMGCHFPGGVTDPESYWQLLRDGRDATCDIPSWRWPVDQFYSDNPDEPGRMYTRRGGFVDGIENFDADFFGISPREALRIDPQQRMLLEVTWEALEDAGIPPETLIDSSTGVFVGITGSDYDQVLRSGGSEYLDAYHLTGCSINFGAGRISYLLGLRGPAMAIDTACSSSLVAVDTACRSLRTGQCNLALAGGTNALLIPDGFVTTCKAHMLAVDGRCKTFDASANGFARAEGCGIVVLKRLADAQADGDRILALILGTAVNQDGRSSGLTVPNRHAQEAVIREALEFAGVSPSTIQYVEAHGTGTPLGDPIEVRALANVLGQDRAQADPFYLASVKTNIGHLESAAGIAGLLKVILSLRNRQIPPHLNLREPNPRVDWNEIPVRVPTSLTPWPEGSPNRLAGISSFGGSGTNSHAIIGEAPKLPESGTARPRPLHLLTVSARTGSALRSAAKRLENHLALHPEASIADVCHTANAGRTHFPQRISVLCADAAEAREKLRDCFATPAPTGVMASHISGRGRPRVAFLFTGQGSQYAGMGRSLFESSPAFRAALERCAEVLRPYLELPLLSVIFPPDDAAALVNETRYTQPALFSLEYALSEHWRSWGIEPSFVMGHSVGEYVAACVAGVFSLEDGLRLIAERARLMQAEPPGGRMVAVGANEEQVRSAIEPFARTVSIAAINGPRSVVISGAATDIDTIVNRLSASGVACKPLMVSHAFHSPLMEPMLSAYEKIVREVKLQDPKVPLISNLTGRLATTGEVTDPNYWLRHVREPVRFSQGMQSLAEAGCHVFLELGPSPVLLGMARQSVEKPDVLWLPTLRANRNDWVECLQSLQALYHAGAAVDWKGVDRDYPCQKISLPTYPFERERFWVEPAPGAALPEKRLAAHSDGGNPLVGTQLRSPAIDGHVFQMDLSAQHPAFLNDHKICGRVIMPAAAFMEMVLAASRQLFGERSCCVENLALQQVLPLAEDSATTLQLIFRPADGETTPFEIFSTSADGQDKGQNNATTWTRHAVGKVRVADQEIARGASDRLQAIRNRCVESLDIASFYERMWKQGSEFGPAFRNVRALLRGERESLAEIKLTQSLASAQKGYRFHPALLDACFQAAVEAIVPDSGAKEDEDVLLPVAIESVRVMRDAPDSLWSHSRLRESASSDGRTFVMDMEVCDQDGRAIASVAGFQVKRVKRSVMENRAAAGSGEWLYQIEWRETLPPAKTEPEHSFNQPGTWLILADENGLGGELRDRLAKLGQKCVLATPGTRFLSQGNDQFEIDPASPADFARLFAESGIASQSPLRGVIHLWSLNRVSLDSMNVEDLTHAQLLSSGAALHLVQALVSSKTDSSPRLWLVTRGAQPAGKLPTPVNAASASLWGLGRVIAAEHPELRCQRIDLDPSGKHDTDSLMDLLRQETFAEDELAIRGDTWLAPRLVPLSTSTAATSTNDQTESKPVQLEVSEPAILENLRWIPVERTAPAAGEVEIEVRATGLNFRDVLCALGMYPGKVSVLGAECAGVIARVGEGVNGLKPGDRVMALAPGGFSTYIKVRADFVAPLPETMTLAEAAAIPAAFLTAMYGLHRLGRMKAGDRVLIHAAAGGVGLAAVQLAQRAGAEIFATAGSAEKRSHLQSLGVTHVLDSRSLDFADEIMRRTGGRGVDIVLNSLAGEFIAKSVQVLAPGGRFLELGKRGILTRGQFSASRPDCEYYFYDLGESALADSSLLPALYAELRAAFQTGELRPLRATIFQTEQIVDAFRFMAQAKHIGKIVVTKPGADVAPSSSTASAAKFRLRGDASYLVTGGLGGVGLETARWMAQTGARNLVLMGRHDPAPETKIVLDGLRGSGVKLQIEKCDVSDLVQLTAAFKRISESMPPLRGIIHAAGVLDDGVLVQQSWRRFENVMAPKVRGAWNLHLLSASLDLDFMVYFSAAAAIIGSSGQGNYAAANAFMDGLAYARNAMGLPALSINWGVWAEVGMAARLGAKETQRWNERGLRPIGLEEGTKKLGEMIGLSRPQIVAMPVDWPRYLTALGTERSSSFFAEVAQGSQQGASSAKRAVDDVAARISAEPAARRLAVLQSHVESIARRALGVAAGKSLSPRTPLHELGLDSLMSVELRNALAASLGRTLPATLLFDYPTIESLTTYLAKDILKLETTVGVATDAAAATQSQDLKELEEMDESEAEALLLEELDKAKISTHD